MDFIITNEKIEVTASMMKHENMINGLNVGIPVDPKDPSKGLIWKKMLSGEMLENDYDAIEKYFLIKQT